MLPIDRAMTTALRESAPTPVRERQPLAALRLVPDSEIALAGPEPAGAAPLGPAPTGSDEQLARRVARDGQAPFAV